MNSESLIGLLMQTLGGSASNELSQQIGTSDQKTRSALEVAVPLLIGALGKNTEDADGAADLSRALRDDHSGALLQDLTGYLGKGGDRQDGDAILKHVLGSKRGRAERGVAQSSGLDENQAAALLEILAPVVLGALGKKQQEGGLDAGDLSGVLQRERQQTRESQSPIAALVTEILDSNDDGSILDDIIKMVSGFFGGNRR
jgi:hypothetical protein